MKPADGTACTIVPTTFAAVTAAAPIAPPEVMLADASVMQITVVAAAGHTVCRPAELPRIGGGARGPPGRWT